VPFAGRGRRLDEQVELVRVSHYKLDRPADHIARSATSPRCCGAA